MPRYHRPDDVIIVDLPCSAAELAALQGLARRMAFGDCTNALRTALWQACERQGMNLSFDTFAARGPDMPDVPRRRATRQVERP